jgi:site-specific DNA-methyltransferase (adenine-specific)
VQHPAPFPVELPERLIHLYTYEGDVVLDPFCGSGTTLVAAARTGRVGVGYDTDPAYVSLAGERVATEGATSTPPADPAKGFADLAEDALTAAGLVVDRRGARLRGTGLVADLLVRPPAGPTLVVELAGAFTVPAGGLTRMEAVWRVLGRASAVRAAGLGPVLVLTSHLPAPGTDGALALRAAIADGLLLDVVDLGAPDAGGRLAGLARTRPDPAAGEVSKGRPPRRIAD